MSSDFSQDPLSAEGIRSRRCLAALIAVAMLAVAGFVFVSGSESSEAATSGSCGENLTWSYDEGTYALTITGTGAMSDFYGPSNYPGWYSYRASITSVSLPDGLTSIGSSAFSGCGKLTGIEIPGTVKTIGNNAFDRCIVLSKVVIPDSVETIGQMAFQYCNNLVQVTLGSSVASIGLNAFANDNKLFEIVNRSNLELKAGSNDYGYIAKYAVSITDGAGTVTFADGLVYADCGGTMYLLGRTTDSENLVLPDKIAGKDYVIHNSAFRADTSLESVTVGSGAKSIGNSAFNGCTNLTTVSIPDSVVSLDNNVFSGCTALASVFMGSGISTIGDTVFERCTALTSLVLPKSLEKIGEYVFKGCTSLTSLTIDPANPRFTITDGAMLSKDGTEFLFMVLDIGTSYTFPSTVESIAAGAFQGNTTIQSVTLPDSVKTVKDTVFSGCTKLATVSIGSGLESLGDKVFHDCSALVSFTVSAENPYFSSADGVLFDKAKTELILYPAAKTGDSYTLPSTVRSIGEYAFYGNDTVATVTLADVTESIDDNAFLWCVGLTTVVTGSKLTEIGDSAFNTCGNLTTIDLSTVRSIGNRAFAGCSKISAADLSSAEEIGDSAFEGCSALTVITLPASVEEIKYGVFSGCSSIEAVKIGDGPASIGNLAFYGCAKLESIVIPDSVGTIGESAFAECTSLTDVTIGNGTKSIAKNAFYKAPIATITIGSGLESLPDPESVEIAFRGIVFYDFAGTAEIPQTPENLKGTSFVTKGGKLTSTYPSGKCGTDAFWSIDDGVLSVTGTGKMADYPSADNCPWYTVRDTITSVKVADGITTIGKCAFDNCANLVSVDIADSVGYIGPNAFRGCAKLESFDMPDSVTEVALSAFSNCTALKHISLSVNLQKVGDHLFSHCKVLEDLAFGDKVTFIDNDVISDCPGLKTLTIGKAVENLAHAFYYLTFTDSEGVELDNTSAEALRGHSFMVKDGKFVMVGLDADGSTYSKTSDSNSASISAVDLDFIKSKAESDSSFAFEIGLKDGISASFDDDAVKSFTGAGTLSVTAVSKETLDEATKAVVGDMPVYEIDFGSITAFGEGKATFTLPYTLPSGADASKVKVYHVSNGAITETIDGVYMEGKVSFSTGHLSTYCIGVESSDDDSSDDGSSGKKGGEFPIAIVAVIAVVAIAAIVAFFFFTQRKP